MKRGIENSTKVHYQRLRRLDWATLWNEEVARFNGSSVPDRAKNVAVVRAVGVVFSESGDPSQKAEVSDWLRSLLRDPEEKVRRYAMSALPKIGAGAADERGLLDLLKVAEGEREKRFLGKSLSKIGGTETIRALDSLPVETRLKVQARLARQESPSKVRMNARIREIGGLRIQLRGRRGLEEIVRDEVIALEPGSKTFRVVGVAPGLVTLEPKASFSLEDIYRSRCFGTMAFVLGVIRSQRQEHLTDEVARAIASPVSQRLFSGLTEGTPRYRIDFVGKGHQRGAVREIAEKAFRLCSAVLNDPSEAPWCVDVLSDRGQHLVELRPRFSPDPRFCYRRQDVPAASHPPMAACMARLAGPMEDEVVWDPFCGSGLELIERTRLGGVRHLLGSDRSAEAIEIAADNFESAGLDAAATFKCCDFRDFARLAGWGEGSMSLIITNPPLGKRVPVPNLGGMIRDLLAVSERMLRPGGRLVFANPTPAASRNSGLTLLSSRDVDFGGFDCRLEHYVKSARPRVFRQKSANPRE